MKTISFFAVVFTATASIVNAAEMSANFDLPAVSAAQVCKADTAKKWESLLPALSPLKSSENRLTAQERQDILLSFYKYSNPSWKISSSHPYATNWMPVKFKLVGGSTLLVDIYANPEAFQQTTSIPVKIVGDKYEFGYWNYTHCGPSMTFPSCYFKIKVQLEVVSASVLQGTIFSQSNTGNSEDQFVLYRE